MTDLELTVRRNALLMWGLAVLGVPFVIFGVDILFERRLATTITDLIYPSDAVQAPPFETHDLAWAWVFLIVGGAMTVWALKELIAPRRVLQGDARGIGLAVGGPFASPIRLPWSDLLGADSGTADDGAGTYPVLVLRLADPEKLPANPWGARWGEHGTLVMAAGEWDVPAAAIAERLLELATFYREPAEVVARPRSGDRWEELQAPPLVDGPWVRPDGEHTEELPETVTSDSDEEDAEPADAEPVDAVVADEEPEDDGEADESEPDDEEE